MPLNKLRFFQNTIALSAITLIIVVWATVSFLTYQNNLLKKYVKDATTTVDGGNNTLVTNKTLNDWKLYSNKKYGFTTKYYPDSPPNEIAGNEEVGQFTYLFLVRFGTNPIKSRFGYEVRVSRMTPNYRGEIVGHTADQIDSEEKIIINGYEWVKLNFQVFLTADYVAMSMATIDHGGYSYAITSSSHDIDHILSTFNFSKSCSSCPLYSPPAPGWCKNGTIVAGEKDECGCQQPPTCLTNN